MKKYISYIILFTLIIILGYYSSLHYIESETLTKKQIWSIINNIDGTLLGIMTKNGEKELTDASKIEYTIKYIVHNMEKYIEDIEEEDTFYEKNNTIYYDFGKINEEKFNQTLLNFFDSINSCYEEYYLYKDHYINLVYEPIEYISTDTQTISSYYIYKGKINVYVKYIRNIDDVYNTFDVKYVFDKDSHKICNVIVLNSYMN